MTDEPVPKKADHVHGINLCQERPSISSAVFSVPGLLSIVASSWREDQNSIQYCEGSVQMCGEGNKLRKDLLNPSLRAIFSASTSSADHTPLSVRLNSNGILSTKRRRPRLGMICDVTHTVSAHGDANDAGLPVCLPCVSWLAQ
jgi:hypothetical protein